MRRLWVFILGFAAIAGAAVLYPRPKVATPESSTSIQRPSPRVSARRGQVGEPSRAIAEEARSYAVAEQSGFSFQPYVTYPIGDWRDSTNGNPDTTAIGDVTGDGRGDVVMVTVTGFGAEVEHRVFVYVQGEDGVLKAPAIYPYTAGLYERANNFFESGLALADLNRDGVQDIVVGYGKGLAIFVSDGAGGFWVRKQLIAAEFRNLDPVWDKHFVKNVVVLDIDRDGKLDVIAHNGVQGATLFFGDGQGGVTETTAMATPVNGIDDVKRADVTGDGFMDLVVLAGARYNRKFWILPNIGTRSFGSPGMFTLPGDETYSALAVGDWNGDRRNDIAVSLYSNTTNTPSHPARLLIHDQTTAGAFAAPREVLTHDLPKALLSVDLDGDGRDEIVVNHHGWGVIGYYPQGGSGLGSEVLVGTGSSGANTQALSAGDVNGDGCADVAMTDTNFGLIILRGRGCIPPRAGPSLSDACGLETPLSVALAGDDPIGFVSPAAQPDANLVEAPAAVRGWRSDERQTTGRLMPTRRRR